MTDYLEMLLPPEEDRDEVVLELPGVRPPGAAARQEQPSVADGFATSSSETGGHGQAQRIAAAADGPSGEPLEDRGQKLERDMDRVRGARERTAGERVGRFAREQMEADSAASLERKQAADENTAGFAREAEKSAAGSVSGRLIQEGAGTAPSRFSAGIGQTLSQAAALSSAAERLRWAVRRQTAAEPAAEPTMHWNSIRTQPSYAGEDPALLVDAAFQRDARRYDGALGLL